MYGFAGKMLVVDLTGKTSSVIEKDTFFYKKYPGGALLCALLFEELTQSRNRITPFMPENPIVFAPGPMAGGSVCGATRVNIMSLSPESTGIYLSQAGGEFGPAIKRAGFDGLALTGKSKKPVILKVTNSGAVFMDAGPLWGRSRNHAHESLSKALGEKYCIASIGPAGENRACHANIMFEPDHYAGRGGLGAVLGDKNVKAVAAGGDAQIVFKDPDTVKAINKKGGLNLARSIKKSPASFLGVLRQFGTFGLLELNRKTGNLPTQNFKSGAPKPPETGAAFDYKQFAEEQAGHRNPCKNCFLACKKQSKTKPEYTSLAEYESAAILGANIGLENDIEKCLEACELCNRLGLDTISTGNIIAWLMDCFENKIVFEKDLGFKITFGDGEKVIALIEDMAHRKTKLGNLLADGVQKAADYLGKETKPFLKCIKGMGMPAHIPHKKPGVGFAYLHGPNPTDHMKLEHDWIASDRQSLAAFNLNVRSGPKALDNAKIEVARTTQFYYAAIDVLSLCLFIFAPGNVYTFKEIVTMLNAATGFDFTFSDLMEIGERSVQLQRKLYLHHGGSDEKYLPFLAKELPDGPSKGACIKKADFDKARKYYYRMMGWNEKGRPEKETLQRLGI